MQVGRTETTRLGDKCFFKSPCVRKAGVLLVSVTRRGKGAWCLSFVVVDKVVVWYSR